MIVVTLKGGLGNQMFQYAAAKSLALKHNTEVCIDKSFLNADPQGRWTKREYHLDVFPALRNLKEYSTLNKITGKLSARQRFTETGLTYNKEFENCGNDIVLDGYFQSEKYFLNCADEIRRDFSFVAPDSEINRSMLHVIQHTEDSVSVHIRRGDMVTLKSASEFHGALGIEYYTAAFDRLKDLLRKDLWFFVFSDDIPWAMENIKPPGTTGFMEADPRTDDFDLQLMSLCRHHIIANSSFSWWGAWLRAKANNAVIAPEKWFKDSGPDTSDLIPGSWIRL